MVTAPIPRPVQDRGILDTNTYVEKMESAALDVKVSMFADDVKLQARNRESLQQALDVSSEWASENKMVWNVKKCHVLEPHKVTETSQYFLSGEAMSVSDSAEYLGVTLHHGRVTCEKNMQRVKVACQRIGMLKAAGIHRKHVPSAKLVNICRTFVYPVADYAIRLVPIDARGSFEMSRELELLDYRVAEYTLGCIEKDPKSHMKGLGRIGGRLPRHLKMAKVPDWLQRIRMRLRSLRIRLRNRARVRGIDGLAKADPLKYRIFRQENKSPSDLPRDGLITQWEYLCRARKRIIPVPEKGHLPILSERDVKVRDAGIRWYTGAFPGRSDDLKEALGLDMYISTMAWLGAGLVEKRWTAGVRKRTMQSIRSILDVRARTENPDTSSAGVRKRGRPGDWLRLRKRVRH